MYLKLDGTICNKSCYGGVCGQHIDRVILIPCQGCGRGTHSASGYCAAPGPCFAAQRAAISRTARSTSKHITSARAKCAPLDAADTELDKFVDELLAEIAV